MKKLSMFLGMVIIAISFTACTSSKTTNSLSSSESKTSSSSVSKPSDSSMASTSASSSVTSSSSDEANQNMNLTQISSGDYSSLMGIWKNAEGKTLTFDSTGKVVNYFGTGKSGVIKDLEKIDGLYSCLIADPENLNGPAGGARLTFAPKRMDVNKTNTKQSELSGEALNPDPSDISKDRLFFTQNTPFIISSMLNSIYYHVE